MRCSRCDAAIPIGGEMCVKCGYNMRTKKTEPNWVSPIPDPAPPIPDPIPPIPDPIPPVPKPKPKKHWFRGIFLTLLACLVGRYVGNLVGNLMAQRNLQGTNYHQESVQETANPAFEIYLSQKGLSYTPRLRNSECFITELEAGYFEVMEFGHSDDKLTEFYETIFLSMEGYSASEAEDFKSNALLAFGAILNPLYASMEEETQGNFYVLRIHYSNLDDQNVIQTMVNDGFVEANSLIGRSVRYISMEKTIEHHLANGSIQR